MGAKSTIKSAGVATSDGVTSTSTITTTTLEAKSTIKSAGITSTGVVTTAGLQSSATVTVAGIVKATSFETTSDVRLKQNITALSRDRLRNLLSIQGVSFQWRRDQSPE